MTVTVSTDVFCDYCQAWCHGVVGSRALHREAHAVVARVGWVRRREAHRVVDLCPSCAPLYVQP